MKEIKYLSLNEKWFSVDDIKSKNFNSNIDVQKRLFYFFWKLNHKYKIIIFDIFWDVKENKKQEKIWYWFSIFKNYPQDIEPIAYKKINKKDILEIKEKIKEELIKLWFKNKDTIEINNLNYQFENEDVIDKPINARKNKEQNNLNWKWNIFDNKFKEIKYQKDKKFSRWDKIKNRATDFSFYAWIWLLATGLVIPGALIVWYKSYKTLKKDDYKNKKRLTKEELIHQAIWIEIEKITTAMRKEWFSWKDFLLHYKRLKQIWKKLEIKYFNTSFLYLFNNEKM